MGILAEKGHFLCYKGLRLGLIDRMQQMIVGATFALIVLYLIADRKLHHHFILAVHSGLDI